MAASLHESTGSLSDARQGRPVVSRLSDVTTSWSAAWTLVKSCRLRFDTETKPAMELAESLRRKSLALCDESSRLVDTCRASQRPHRLKQAEPADLPPGSPHWRAKLSRCARTTPGTLGSGNHRCPEATLPPKAVLVVDDEPHVRSLISDLLRARGYEVAEAVNGRLALDQIRQRSFDLIISDLKMPELGGQGLYQQLANVQHGLLDRFILITGVNDNGTEFFNTQTAVPVIAKPFKLAQLSEMVHRVLRRASATESPV
jgi:CheY-like chemotaxis protein